MKKNKFHISQERFFSFTTTLLLYLIIICVFSFIDLKKTNVETSDIFIEFRQKESVENFTESKKYIQRSTEKKKTIKENKGFIVEKRKKLQNSETHILSINNSDSSQIKYSDTFQTVFKSIDSLLYKSPSIYKLKMVVAENIKKNGVRKTNNQLIIARIEKSMQDYYKMKYPTPIHKFGEQGGGAGIRIPIDDIIELFE